MRILHVIASMNPKQGGVSQAVLSMIHGLNGLHIDNEVVSLDDPNTHFLSEPATTLTHALGPGKSPWCYNGSLVPWLVNNFSRFNGIIVHGLWLYPSYAVAKAMRIYSKQLEEVASAKKGLPRIFMMPHGMLDPYFQQSDGRKLKALRNKIYWKLIEGNVINKSSKVLFTTQEEHALAQATFSPYKPMAEAIVGLGVEEPPCYSLQLKEAFRQKYPQIGDLPYLLFLSRIHEKKGLHLLIDAYHSLLLKETELAAEKKQQPLPKLVIAGPGLETAYGEKIKQMVATNPLLALNVFFTGMITGDAKWGAFYGCEAFVLPSYQENFGIAVVEAMACEKPVLISDSVNIWREILEAGAGMVSQPTGKGTEKLLQSWFQSDQEKKKLMGQKAQQLFQNSFAVETAAKRLAMALDIK